MKKVIFALLIVLLAMLAVTCDNVVMLQNSSTAVLPAAGDPDVVTVSIKIAEDRARALNKTYAQSIVEGADGFYEVVFNTSTMTVRDNVDRTKFDLGWKVTVPRAQYTTANTTNKAVLFVGTKSDKTLLAIGAISADVDFTDPLNDDASITFALAAITSELTNSNTTSSFTIPSTLTGYRILPTTATIEGVTNPQVHQIPKDTTVAGASYTFAGLPANIVSLANSAHQYVSVASITPGVSLDMGTVTSPGSFLTATQAITFTFDTSNSEGYAKIYVEVPVFAINSTKNDNYGKPEAIMWYIRGGVTNKTVDIGGVASTSNPGGAVLIELYDPSVVGGIPVVTPTWP